MRHWLFFITEPPSGSDRHVRTESIWGQRGDYCVAIYYHSLNISPNLKFSFGHSFPLEHHMRNISSLPGSRFGWQPFWNQSVTQEVFPNIPCSVSIQRMPGLNVCMCAASVLSPKVESQHPLRNPRHLETPTPFQVTWCSCFG